MLPVCVCVWNVQPLCMLNMYSCIPPGRLESNEEAKRWAKDWCLGDDSLIDFIARGTPRHSKSCALSACHVLDNPQYKTMNYLTSDWIILQKPRCNHKKTCWRWPCALFLHTCTHGSPSYAERQALWGPEKSWERKSDSKRPLIKPSSSIIQLELLH